MEIKRDGNLKKASLNGAFSISVIDFLLDDSIV